ncbi:MAG: Oligopeptide ABC transporter, ATP-binding protein [Methanocalculus sp. 52_23]|nr:MAG: Oligopeptide ABC transporter, ATP-binding protein [Methanocalculus sp. 52_23]
MTEILQINDLYVHFPLPDTTVRAVDGVDLAIRENETLAIIGESGCGKSVIGLAVLGLLPHTCTIAGEIHYQGSDILGMPEHQLESVRGKKIAWVPQNPSCALNPSMKIGDQIGEPCCCHTDWEHTKIRQRVLKLLEFIRILPSEERVDTYPHTFSGGMLQRALVAMGLSITPDILIADEPTKGLDNLNKKAITSLFRMIRGEGITLILITHDLLFARCLADRIGVMYSGRFLEISDTRTFFSKPHHPYSEGLIKSLPENGLHPIPGKTDKENGCDSGCRFRLRCSHATDRCLAEPPLISNGNGSLVRCWLYDRRS